MTLVSFIRQLLSYQVTEGLGPTISTILAMFADVKNFIVIWIYVILGYSVVAFITY